MNITDSLAKNVNANSSKNYDIFIKLVQENTVLILMHGKLNLISISIKRINGFQGVFSVQQRLKIYLISMWARRNFRRGGWASPEKAPYMEKKSPKRPPYGEKGSS